MNIRRRRWTVVITVGRGNSLEPVVLLSFEILDLSCLFGPEGGVNVMISHEGDLKI